MADMLQFKKGLYGNLPEAKQAGTIYVTTDEKAMYFDVDNSTRIRLGDIVQVQTVNNLRDMAPDYSPSALYYVIDENALLAYTGNGTTHTWKQLNSISDVTANLEQLTQNVSNLSTTLGEVQTDVNTIKGDYLTSTDKQTLEQGIQGAVDAAGAAQEAAEGAQEAADKVAEDLSTFQTNVSETYETKEDATAKLTEAKGYTDSLANGQVKTNTEAIATEKGRAEAAEEALSGRIDGVVENLGTISTSVGELQTAVSTTIPSTYETKEDATAKLTEAKGYTDTKIGELTNGAIKTNADNIAKNAEDISTLGTTLSETAAAIREEFAAADEATLQTAKAYTDSALIAADAMTFEGVLGGENNIQSLPDAEDVKAGQTYKIGEFGEYAGITCYVGDLLIAKEDGVAEYFHISSGYEDDYDPVLNAVVAENKVILEDTVHENRGSIQFAAAEDSGITVAMTGTVDEQTHIAETVVTIGFEWGSF